MQIQKICKWRIHEKLINIIKVREKQVSHDVFHFEQTIEAFLPVMLQRGSGHIVAMSSMCGIYGVSQKVAYCSSKFAVRGIFHQYFSSHDDSPTIHVSSMKTSICSRGLMEALHEEIRFNEKKADIHFTTIYPFYIDTGLAKDPKYRWSLFINEGNWIMSSRYIGKEHFIREGLTSQITLMHFGFFSISMPPRFRVLCSNVFFCIRVNCRDRVLWDGDKRACSTTISVIALTRLCPLCD